MVLNCGNKALAHLADGSVCWWSGSLVDKPTIKAHAALTVKACRETGLHVILTHDGRVLVGMNLEHELTDITNSVPVEVSKELLECSTMIHVFRYTITLKTQYDVAFLNVTLSNNTEVFTVTSSTLYTFPCGINLADFGYGHGFVRTPSSLCPDSRYHPLFDRSAPSSLLTSDNCLYLVDGDCSRNGKGCRLVDIADPENIQEIIPGCGYTLLFMKDGTVRTCGLFGSRCWWPCADRPFEQIEFPEEVLVAKVINIMPHIFFITTEGLCYYINAGMRDSKVSLIEALAGLHIENMFVTKWYIIAQHSKSNISNISMLTYLNAVFSTDASFIVKNIHPKHINGEQASIPLPFFDGKSIVTVQQIGDWLYLTTNEGNVYHCISWSLGHKSKPKASQFFVDRPVMIECDTARIGSAASVLDDI